MLSDAHKGYVFSLIQKFNQLVTPDNPYSTRDDVIVITDEAHRTQYGQLALNMRNALPNARVYCPTPSPVTPITPPGMFSASTCATTLFSCAIVCARVDPAAVAAAALHAATATIDMTPSRLLHPPPGPA